MKIAVAGYVELSLVILFIIESIYTKHNAIFNI